MSDIVLGKSPDKNANRDAIHIAVAPVESLHLLSPGQHVGLAPGENHIVEPSKNPIGIVDPFLKKDVEIGEKFWLLLYPRTITTLRHHWIHPAFNDDEESEKELSKIWLKGYAENIGISYGELLIGISNWIQYGEYFARGGLFEGVRTSDAFWEHYEKATGITVPKHRKEPFFSCSC